MLDKLHIADIVYICLVHQWGLNSYTNQFFHSLPSPLQKSSGSPLNIIRHSKHVMLQFLGSPGPHAQPPLPPPPLPQKSSSLPITIILHSKHAMLQFLGFPGAPAHELRQISVPVLPVDSSAVIDPACLIPLGENEIR